MTRQPPILATWLLTHLARGPQIEALTGDILERFAEKFCGSRSVDCQLGTSLGFRRVSEALMSGGSLSLCNGQRARRKQ